jgi:hypothetical protein
MAPDVKSLYNRGAMKPWQKSPINPRTGEVWRLTDVEVLPSVEAEIRRICATPEKARAYLIKSGFLTKGGRLPKRYGG